ncbi:MAG TPA: LuxR C-terminal-related transcriptional regulator [Euzebyales bacterium]|nr:LuxR C-terminal-related transcriptional regulator [Euzebyales bacterium]
MAGPLLETKLYVPSPRRALVPRPRLRDRLGRGNQATLTLVSAPAGFGKTTLLAEWLAASGSDGRGTAWLSLDRGDNQPTAFWTYLVAALRTAAPGVGADALALLQSPQRPAIDVVLAVLLNELTTVPHDVVLVLDDYHVIDARDIHDGIAFLVDHLPAHVHLVIAGRADPALPLARLRARGDLVEIRAADLRFTPDEAAAFLNQVMALDLSVTDMAALETRTEGWIAGLQLAALSLQGRDDVAGFIAGFAGDDRYIVDYLVEEVLQLQPEPMRSFLLHTALLDRLSGALCDAVTGRDDSQAVLQALERDNLFVVALDDKRHWYRYHHLFADVLRVRMLAEHPDQIPVLRRRASEWYEQHGMPAEAIRHALAGEDFARAADLIEPTIPAMRRSRQDARLRAWLEALPADLVRVRPVLSIGLVGVLMASGELERVEGPLRDAERWLASDPEWADMFTSTGGGNGADAGSVEMVVIDDEGYRRLPGTIEMYRAALAHARGDASATVRHARRAIDLSPDDDHLNRAAAAGFLGLASWASGDLEAAERAYATCMAGLRRVGHDADVLGSAIALADIRRAQGRLGEAMRTYERALQLVPPHGRSAPRGTADIHVGMSEVHRERNDLHAARQQLRHAEELGEHVGLPQHRYRRRVAIARILQAEGDLDGALDSLDEAERLYDGSDFFPYAQPIPALRARVQVARGDLGAALGWAREHGLSVDDAVSYLREFEHITLSRVLLARSTGEQAGGDLHDATRLLARLLPAAQAGGRTGSVIEILVLQALAQHARDDRAAALAALQRAVTLAGPEGYVRVFLDAGPAIASLLTAAAKQGTARTSVRRLLAAAGRTDHDSPLTQDLVEPLSERELDVLRLLGTDLDGPGIARELVVSLNTVRTHTRNIYRKLGVNNRRSAVRRAEELNLSSRSRRR